METDGSGTIDNGPAVPTVDVSRCSGCGRCVAACPEKIISLEAVRFHKNAVIRNTERCTFCGECVQACPIAALHT